MSGDYLPIKMSLYIICTSKVYCEWSEVLSTVMHVGLEMNRLDVNRPDPAGPWRSLTAYISESIKDKHVKFRHNFELSLQIVLSKVGIDIFNGLENYAFFVIAKISAVIGSYFRRKLKFQIMTVLSERSRSDL